MVNQLGFGPEEGTRSELIANSRKRRLPGRDHLDAASCPASNASSTWRSRHLLDRLSHAVTSANSPPRGNSDLDPFPADCRRSLIPVRVLASGGFGSVWIAEQRELKRPVVVKLLHAAVLEDEDQVARFIDEARVTAMIQHPNVVRVLDHGAATGVPWIAYEYLSGGSLREMLLRCPLAAARALTLISQVASGLSAAHARGVIHRDIKPENVLLGEDDVARIADFGISKWSRRSGFRTATGIILGTPFYMSPEQIRGETAAASADLYSVGVMLFELLTGRVPFTDDNPFVVAERHLRSVPPRVSSVATGIPPALDALVANLLSKTPADRPASALDLAAQVEELLTRLGSNPGRHLRTLAQLARPAAQAPDPREHAPPRAEPQVTGSGRLRMPWLALFLTIVIVSAVAMVMRHSRTGDTIAPAALPARSLLVAEPVVHWRAIDRIEVRFETSAAERWTLLLAGRAGDADATPVRQHVLTVPLSPWEDVPGLAISDGRTRIDIPAPEALTHRLHRLSAHCGRKQLSDPRFCEKAWLAIAARIKSTYPNLHVEVAPDSRRAISRSPQFAAPFDELLQGAFPSTIRETWASLRPWIGAALTSPATPEAEVSRLVDALWPMARADAVADHLGLPLPFGVSEALGPAIEIRAHAGTPGERLPGLRVFPKGADRGALLYLPGEVSAVVGDLLNQAEPVASGGAIAARDRDPTARIEFSVQAFAGTDGRVFRLRVQALTALAFLRLSPSGTTWGLPVRVPPGMGLRGTEPVLVEVRLHGALAQRRGTWNLEHTRAVYSDRTRPCVIVDEVVVE